MDCEPEISRFIPLFYPSSEYTPPDPASTVARLVHDVDDTPVIAATLATDLPHFLLYSAFTHPTHTDHILQTIKLLLDASLPLVAWSARPGATFAEMFHVAFRDDVNDAIRGPVEFSERACYIAASIVGARARSLGMLNTPEILGSLEEGLNFSSPPDVVLDDYQGEEAEIAVIGSCLQLLGGASSVLEHQPWRFTKDKILAALDRVESGRNDILVQFTKSHIQKESVFDLTSEEIFGGLEELGWQLPRDNR